MIKELVHALILILTIVLGFVYPKTNLAAYDLQISAGLFLALYLIKKIFIRREEYSRLIESVVFTLIVVGIVNSTGGVASPFFFLIYFLLFSLSLILEPVISIIATITLVIFFLLSFPQAQDLKSLLPVISMAFLTPFAMYMGQEHIERQRAKSKSQNFKENTYLFLSLLIKNHLKNIKRAVENYVGDHELSIIKKSAERIEKLIEKYEKSD